MINHKNMQISVKLYGTLNGAPLTVYRACIGNSMQGQCYFCYDNSRDLVNKFTCRTRSSEYCSVPKVIKLLNYNHIFYELESFSNAKVCLE